MLISDGLNLSGPTIDMLWVGRLGPTSIAAVGVSGLVLQLMTLGIWGVNIGLRALIGRFIGNGDNEGAKHVGRQALILSASYSTLAAVILIILAKPILNLFGVQPDVLALGTPYLQIALLGAIPTSIYMMTEAVMQATGDTVTPMKISLLMRVTQVGLAPLLIFGWGMFPALGVRGAALSNVISSAVGMGVGLYVVFSGRTRLRFDLKHFRVDFSTMGRILRIGIPTSISSAQRSFGSIILMGFITPFGTLAVASYSLLTRIQQFAFITNSGFGRASAILVSQNLGAGQAKRSERCAWLALVSSECVILVLVVLMLIWSRGTIRIFTPDIDMIDFTSVLLRIMLIGYSVTAFQFILSQSLIGAGDTIPAMLIDLISMWVFTLPMAYILSHSTSLEVYGIWWALAAGSVLSATIYLLYFRTGRWKHKAV
jgi:putative MATE family efflux protein